MVEIDAASAARNEVGGVELTGSASVGGNALSGPTNSGRSQFEHRNLQCSSLGTNVVSSSSDGRKRNSAPHATQRIALRITPTADGAVASSELRSVLNVCCLPAAYLRYHAPEETRSGYALILGC